MREYEAQIAIKQARHYCRGEELTAIELAVEAIIADLNDRRGLKQEWRQIEPDIQEEIAETWRLILSHVMYSDD